MANAIEEYKSIILRGPKRGLINDTFRWYGTL